ncbi:MULTISPECIES: diacylglycerol kinase family protein [Thiorhodovibrio]|uniref:diacylglycerol kinase family protein n=1 Tax=Thiorhodovibrio TaxID=61593 RepID=UPI001911DB74|nr:diacylglycerol kinase family protein [Thiorhodovibrio litoralis]
MPGRKVTPGDDQSAFWSRNDAGGSRKRRVLAVFNPAAGDVPAARDAQTALLSRLQAGLAAHGLQLERIAFNPERFSQVLQERLGDDLCAIFVLGGDGTVLAVVEALHGAQIPVGILPGGTMNWLARDLGLPPDPEQALTALLNPALRQIDLGRVNGHPFLCACMVGVAALLARYRERHRQQPRWRRWPGLFLSALKLWGRYPHLRMSLVTNGQIHRLRSRTLVVVNNRVEPAVRLIPGRPRLDEGVLALYAMRRATLPRLRSLLARLMSEAWSIEDVLLTETGTSLCVELPGIKTLPVLLDGEIRRLQAPLQFSIEARAVPVLVPAN